jgi:four helix bundle protein
MKDDTEARRDLKERTREYALRIIRLYAWLPNSGEAQVLGRQVLRSGTSVGAHYREGMRAKSDADFINKIQGALQELEESAYWLELLQESGIVPVERLGSLRTETDELTAILTAIVKKVKNKD